MPTWSCRWFLALGAVFAAILAAGCGGSGTPSSPLYLRTLSSAPEYVSGANVRIQAGGPAPAELAFELNGRSIAPRLEGSGAQVQAVITGLRQGENVLTVRAPGERAAAALRLINHPITGPMFTGPQQMPFICRTEDSGLGQPLADNTEGIGHPVRNAATGAVVGHSRYCAIERKIGYFYFTGRTFRPFDPATGFANPPPDLARLPLNGASVPFVVRVEGGTINRFIYTIAMLAPYPGDEAANGAAWNRKLIYWMRGGVAIGRQQGTAMWFNDGLRSVERRFMPRILAQGYAVVTSSGNDTSVHYNLRLAEETAMMTKEHFIETYGMPRHTIGMGISGGAIQQYAFAQNRPGLIDGGVPMQSYPDMVTQITPASDCHLLEQYFADEVRRDPASRWARWSERRLIEGFNASDSVVNPVTGTPGSTECIQGWLGSIPTVLNPRYRDPQYDEAARRFGYPADVFDRVTWTHWSDLANIYGTGSAGYAPDTVDNVGVQYGLRALNDGAIGVDEFLRINACVGGWKEQRDFVQWDRAADPFDARNMERRATCRDPQGVPAPRRAGSALAMRRGVASGHVFTGRRLDIPMVDLRPYLEPLLDMHQARQGFSVRARLLARNSAAAERQVIWMTDPRDDLVERAMEALAVVERHLDGATAPADFTDRCFDASGTQLDAGPAAWAGILDGRPAGRCTLAYPIHASPRMVAGDSMRGDRLRCTLKPVTVALADGTYAPSVRLGTDQQRRLRHIFPYGVCDHGAAG